MTGEARTYTFKTIGGCSIQADIHVPPTDGSHPVLVWIHGGALIMGSRQHLPDRQRKAYLDAGYAVVTVDYRLAPETTLPAIVEDLRDAFRWVHTSGPSLFDADPNRLAAVGHSAGGYLTLMSGFSVDPRPRALVAFYGYGDTAREVVAKYGDYANWKNVVGTGPFIVTDFVPGSSVTMIRNSKYFARDPVGPGKGNQLPYLDGVKFLIIPDPSTRLAALRTAKADFMSAVELDDARSLIRTDQPIMYKQGQLGATSTVNMRTDKAELPYKDVRVRQALMYATDFDSINKTLCGGLGILPSWPVVYQKELPGFYLSMKELPQNVQDLYRYNPEKAKQLLKEAGYPNGFKAEIIVSAAAPYPDEVSIFKDMWAKVGIELVLQLKESSVFSSIQTARSHPDMIYGTTSNTGLMFPRGYGTVSGNTFANTSMIDQEYIEKARLASQQAWLIGDYKEQWRTTKEDLLPRVLLEAWAIPFPQKPSFTFWWPWLKNFYGATNPGAFTGAGYQYMWIDQDLKEQMTGRR